MNETSLVGDAVRGPRAFPSTHWSEIGEAGGVDEESAREALGRMLERYQPALLAYLQKKFHADDSMARDLLQGFGLPVRPPPRSAVSKQAGAEPAGAGWRASLPRPPRQAGDERAVPAEARRSGDEIGGGGEENHSSPFLRLG